MCLTMWLPASQLLDSLAAYVLALGMRLGSIWLGLWFLPAGFYCNFFFLIFINIFFYLID